MPVRKNTWILPVLLCLKILLQYCIISPAYDLHRDEYLHLDLGNHPAWGYLSVPPLSALEAIFIHWLGNGEWAVHLVPALFGALTLLVIWRLTAALGGRLYAQVLAATAFIFSSFLRVNMLFQPVSFDILSWTLVYYCLIQYIRTEKSKWMIWLGAALGISFLNKYNVVFLVAGLLPALLLTPQRVLFTRKHFWYAPGIALLIALPNLVWQVQHNFPVVHHMRELSKTQLVNVTAGGFIIDQLMFLANVIFLWAGALVALFLYAPFRPYRAVAWSFFFVIIIYIVAHGKSYYAFGLYPTLMAFGSVYFEHLFQAGRQRYWRVAWLLIPVALMIRVADIVFPISSPAKLQTQHTRMQRLGLLHWEDGKDHLLPQDFADMQGWHDMAALALSAYRKLPDSVKPNILVICGNYGQAGALNYYNRGKMPEAIAYNADYAYWFPKIDTLQAIILLDDEPDELAKKVSGSIVKEGEVTNAYAREQGTAVFTLTRLQPGLLELLRKKAKATVNEYEGRNSKTLR
ncbi:Dolichyl-phosphate-mannose-protein mannosyltransferase [Chitinophaga costaii]|uniref:Dolichyl-phosphate-mannose-protein mannosyltransferase n=1 Tax=Chitinophaga costaii TaxID=1335309 RepID=A0A1C4B3V2_9BACT|nr:glycosyltransferase family 39 protein [Chitinophaga costaii]SCC01565.1 Dolichyl-phosphate-mannose-protein mannosyltransferase [Chitinophaga costaii]